MVCRNTLRVPIINTDYRRGSIWILYVPARLCQVNGTSCIDTRPNSNVLMLAYQPFQTVNEVMLPTHSVIHSYLPSEKLEKLLSMRKSYVRALLKALNNQQTLPGTISTVMPRACGITNISENIIEASRSNLLRGCKSCTYKILYNRANIFK